jgi:PAS domain S-box-containing protein
LFFAISTFLIDVIVPNWDFYLAPTLVHIIGVPPIVAILYSLSGGKFQQFNEEIISGYIMKRLQVMVIFIDAKDQIFGANQFTQDLLGYGGIEIQELTSEKLFDDVQNYHNMIQMAKKGKDIPENSIDLLTKDGRIIKSQVSLVVIHDKFSKIVGFVLIGLNRQNQQLLELKFYESKKLEESAERNHYELQYLLQQKQLETESALARLNSHIGENKQAENQIKYRIVEKDGLIREMHHRVKNNLQIIISLTNFIDLDSKTTIKHHAVLLKIIDRIRKISVIHDDFYASPTLSRIQFGEYIHHAISAIQSQYSYAGDILLKINATKELLAVNQAIPLGIILNELVSNVFTHAFVNPDKDNITQAELIVNQFDSSGIIRVDFHKENNLFCLSIRDNGVGINKNWKEQVESGAGLYLVEVLVSDYLHGDLSVVNSFGTVITVTFTN